MNAHSFAHASLDVSRCDRILSARGSGLGPATISLTEFRPPELERITGFPHTLQRLWRCRGHLDKRERYTTRLYSSLELAELFVRYRLSTSSVPPPRSRAIGARAARLVLFAALTQGNGACEVTGDVTRVRRFLNAFSQDDTIAAALCGGGPELGRFLWSADGGDFRFGNWHEAEFLSGSHHSYTFLDLEAMGARIARLAGRPLVRVAFAPAPNGRSVSLRTKPVH